MERKLPHATPLPKQNPLGPVLSNVSKVMAAYFWREYTNIIGFVMKKL